MALEDVPEELRQEAYIAQLSARPTQWVTVWASQFEADVRNGGVTSYLCPVARRVDALLGVTWAGGSLGESYVWRSGEECLCVDGLTDGDDVQFFVDVKSHHGLTAPDVEFHLPFLWYFEAIPRPNGAWYYLSEGGADLELIRTHLVVDGRQVRGTVEVAALPLRRYLAATKSILVVQHDYVVFSPTPVSRRAEATIDEDWRRFDLHVSPERGLAKGSASFSRLLGKHIVLAVDTDPCEEEDPEERGPFPDYIYGINPASGEPLTFTCNEASLSNYFVTIQGAPHYLTPVYFRREVLTKYAQQPAKYSVGQRGLSCLGLWSLRFDINPEGLVEVYLGDLGKYLPAEEREYWRTFNVPPSGGMNESRFRMDFLGQVVEADDPIAALWDARYGLNKLSHELWGRPLYNDLGSDDRAAWEGLHLMTTKDVAERDSLIIVVAKGIVDSLNIHLLRDLANETEGKSLQLLEQLVVTWGGEPAACISPLRLTQSLRSSGAAHVRGERYEELLRKHGLHGLAPDQQFERLVRQAASGLVALQGVLSTLKNGRSE